MNRAQKRAQAGEAKRRKRLVSQRQYKHYQTNARRWCVGIRATGRHIGSELQEAREALMADLERTANGRYVWDKLYIMECLG